MKEKVKLLTEAEALQRLRDKVDCYPSLRDFARSVNVSPAAISQVLTGDYPLGRPLAARLLGLKQVKMYVEQDIT